MPPKKVTITLDGEKVDFKQGALRKQLKVAEDYKFTKTALEKLRKIPTGDKFKFQGKDFTMTTLMKRRIAFALVLMKK